MLRLFVDTDAFIALAKVDDASHDKAIGLFALLEQQAVQYVTSNYVFSEVVTILSQRVNHATSLQFIERMHSSITPFPIEWITPAIESKAIDIFRQQTSKNVSFVDCTNMALCDDLRLDGIFSFDRAYRTNGYQLVENLISLL